ncbi:MAG: nucleotidyltransferase domain-containing protein [Candidatus Pacearchaeota archaeon]|nr:nucleotidyltransferase domain-containing protein [Candidatus Pacearchaeota archaeon]
MDRDRMNEKEILLRIVEKIKKNYQTQKIIVFGSYAWGRPTKDSDVDLFIIIRKGEVWYS